METRGERRGGVGMYAALLKVDFDMLAHTRMAGQSAAHRREDVNTSSMSVQGGRECVRNLSFQSLVSCSLKELEYEEDVASMAFGLKVNIQFCYSSLIPIGATNLSKNGAPQIDGQLQKSPSKEQQQQVVAGSAKFNDTKGKGDNRWEGVFSPDSYDPLEARLGESILHFFLQPGRKARIIAPFSWRLQIALRDGGRS